MKVYRRKGSPYYQVRIHGRRLTLRTVRRVEAERMAAELMVSSRARELGLQPREKLSGITLAGAALEYERLILARQASPHGQQWALQQAVAFFGERRLIDITRSDVKDWIATLKTRRSQTTGFPLSIASIRLCRATASTLVTHALGEDAHNPFRGGGRALGLKLPKHIPETVRMEQVGRLLRAVRGDKDPWNRQRRGRARWWPDLVVMALHGLRPGEVTPLEVDDVDFDRRLLSITKSHERSTTKTGDPRILPIHPEALPVLREAVARARLGGRKLLFPDPGGGRQDRDHAVERYRAALKSAARSLGMTGRVYSYLMRRSLLTAVARADGGGAEAAQGMGGHASLDMTKSHYLGGSVAELARTALDHVRVSPGGAVACDET